MARKIHPPPKIVGMKRKYYIIILSVEEKKLFPHVEYYVKL